MAFGHGRTSRRSWAFDPLAARPPPDTRFHSQRLSQFGAVDITRADGEAALAAISQSAS